MIQDSGDRREFETGAVRDIQEGKGRCDLLPLDVVSEVINSDFCITIQGQFLQQISSFVADGFDISIRYAMQKFIELAFDGDKETAMLEAAIHYEDGLNKYDMDNWKKGINIRSYIDSAVRHYLKWRRGDTDERHDRAVLWNLLCCLWTIKHKPEMMDI